MQAIPWSVSHDYLKLITLILKSNKRNSWSFSNVLDQDPLGNRTFLKILFSASK